MRKRKRFFIKGFIYTVVLSATAFALFINRTSTVQHATTSNTATSKPANLNQLASIHEDHQARDILQFQTGLEHLPPSFSGTFVDGQFQVAEDGQLIISKDIQQIFEYFLAALGEEDTETILQRIQAYINYALSPPADQQALDILHGYMALKFELAELEDLQIAVDSNPINAAAIRQQKEAIHVIRSRHLDPEVIETFFAEEDAYDHYTLKRIELMQTPGLSPSDKAQRLRLLEDELPPELRESSKKAQRFATYTQLSESLNADGASDMEQHKLRVELLGEEAAERMAELDADRAQWQQRMDSWLHERRSLLDNENLSEMDRQVQIDRLRRERFDSTELRRAQALEYIHDR